MDNSPVPREETTSRVLNNERIRKSIGLLDQATGKFATPGRPSSVARTPGSRLKHSTYTPSKPPMTSQFDVSQTVGVTPNRSFMTPATMHMNNMSRFDQSRLNASLLTTPAYQQDMSGAGLEPTSEAHGDDLTEGFTSTNINLLLDEDPGVAATEGVYEEFQSCFKRLGSPTEVFKLVEEYERACNEQVTLLFRLVNRTGPSKNKFSRTLHVLSELEQEKKTWRLIGSLYSDRINSMESIPTMDMELDSQVSKHSENDIMKDLFENNASVRQDQLIVDWLERNAADQLSRSYDKTEFYSKSVCWENTLHELQQKSASLSSSERSVVAHLDPDAPIRENKPLADLDKEDEVRLLREVFMMVRAGQMEEAQRLCKKCGQAWRAATLEGWRLYHDQNMKEVSASGDLSDIEGNPYRDIWKAVCWRMAEDERFNVFERAIYAALSGNLRELLPACEYWEDCLWAYFKVMVDQNLEASVREKIQIGREMDPLPPVYHEKDLTPSRIFQELQAHPSAVVEQQAKERHRVIQKYVILADLDALIEEMGEWLRDEDSRPSSHMVRFMAHVVLFLRSTGLQTKEEICVAIVEAYVKDLIYEKRIKLVATYTAQLPHDMQISWYANFLEGVREQDERQHCLQLAEEMGLDVPLITKTVVENIRTRDDDPDMGERTPALEAATSEDDRHKIAAIDWLVFDPSQRAEALKQSNAIIRTFLASKKHDAAREVFGKIPEDSIDVIQRNWQAERGGGGEQLLAEDENAIREYLCVKAYLNALDAFNDWFEHYHNRRPTGPMLPDRANFHEKVRYEHEQKDHEMELDRWQHALNIQSQGVVDTITNVLLFVDGGWMVDQRIDGEVDVCRQQQLEGLRQLCIPMMCLLLHSVLHTTGRYRECVALADTIASDHYELYKVFNCAELQQFLGKLRESSLQLLDRDLDPLGYEISS